MTDRPFINKSVKPDEKSLETALGKTFPFYKKIMASVSEFSDEWSYSKSSGWMLKVFSRSKALFYFIPLSGSFKISMAIRENERDGFISDTELSALHEKIKTSKKYSEGFALQIDIAGKKDFQPVEILIRKLAVFRK